MNPSHPFRSRRRRAMSLVEVMISLAITASLLAAVAAAFSASAQATDVNDRFFRATQASRVCLNQMLAAARNSQALDVGSGYAGATTVTASSIRLFTAQGQNVTYRYDSAARKMLLVTNSVTTDPDYALCSNVSAASFTGVYEPDPSTRVLRIVRLTVNLTVTVEGQSVTLSGSTVPRRSMTY